MKIPKLCLCILAVVFFFLSSAGTANAQLVTLTDVRRPLCPTNLVAGDREFGGAPVVTITGRLEINASGSGLVAVINFNARERSFGSRGRERTEVRQEFRLDVFTAPAGRRITGIRGPTTFSVGSRIDSDAGAEFGICKPGGLVLARGGGFVRRIAWVGDTGGDDVASSATSCDCDTHILFINFNRVRIVTRSF